MKLKPQIIIWLNPGSEKIKLNGQTYQINPHYLKLEKNILIARSILTALCLTISYFIYTYAKLEINFGLLLAGILVIIQIFSIPVYLKCFPDDIKKLI